MIEELLSKSLPNLGVGVAAVIVLYFSFKLAVEALDRREQSFRDYVSDNNHKTTEILVEAKNSIKEASENIKLNTEILREVRDHLIREKQ